MPPKSTKAPSASVWIALLWLGMLLFQFTLGRSSVGARPWALWVAGIVEVLIVTIPVSSLVIDLRMRGRWPPARMAALFGKILGLALAMNHLDATATLLWDNGPAGAGGALHTVRVWVLAIILPAAIQTATVAWIVANRSTVWGLRHAGAVALGGAITYVLCIIDGNIQPLDQWSAEAGDGWGMLVCGVLPILVLLSASILWVASLWSKPTRS